MKFFKEVSVRLARAFYAFFAPLEVQEDEKPFKLSDEDLLRVQDSLDETCGWLIKDSEFRAWVEHFVNKDRKVRT